MLALPELVAARVIKLPKACRSRRRFRIALAVPSQARVASVGVTVNGKRARSTRKRARIDLRGLPKGRFTVRITIRLVDGRTVTTKRTYRTCAPKKKR